MRDQEDRVRRERIRKVAKGNGREEAMERVADGSSGLDSSWAAK